MKTTIISLALLFSYFANATEGLCYIEEQKFQIGEQVLFYSVEKAAKVGPAYTCGALSRMRTCELIDDSRKADWSQNLPACDTEDSGGCADFWVDQLPDSAFTYSTCR